MRMKGALMCKAGVLTCEECPAHDLLGWRPGVDSAYWGV